MHRCLLRGCNLSSKGSAVSSLFAISPSRTGDGGAAPADSSQLINRWPTQTKAAESPRADERPRLIWWQLDDSWSVTGNLSYTHTRVWPWMKVMWLLDQSEATSTSEWREERSCLCPEWGRHLRFNSSDLSFICSHLPCSCLRFFLVFEAISVHNCILSHILRYLTWKAHFWKFKTSFIAVSLRSIDAKTEWEWDYWRCCLSWWNIGEKIHHFSIFVSSFSSESLLS